MTIKPTHIANRTHWPHCWWSYLFILSHHKNVVSLHSDILIHSHHNNIVSLDSDILTISHHNYIISLNSGILILYFHIRTMLSPFTLLFLHFHITITSSPLLNYRTSTVYSFTFELRFSYLAQWKGSFILHMVFCFYKTD